MKTNDKYLNETVTGLSIKKINLVSVAEYALRFSLGFVLAQAKIFDGYSPFGVAFSASSPLSMGGAAASLGAVIGYLVMGDMMPALKYIGMIFLIRSTLYILRGTSIAESSLFAPAVALCTACAVGFVYSFSDDFSAVSVSLFSVETAVIGGCTFFYGAVFSSWDSTQDSTFHNVSLIIMLSTVFISLTGIELFGVMSIGRMLAVLSVMVITYKGGIGYGCAPAAFIGACSDLASGTFPFMTAVYSFTSSVSCLFSKDKRIFFLLSFIASNAIAVICCWANYHGLYALYEVFCSSVIFMLIPDSFFSKLSVYFPSTASGLGFLRAREYTRSHVELLSSAFQSMYDTVSSFSPAEKKYDDPAVIFDRASETVCRDCTMNTRCWQQDYQNTVDIMNGITPRLMKSGKISSGDFPLRFADTCTRLDKLTSAINSEAHTLLLKKQFKSIISENQVTAYSQYADTALVLHFVSQELGNEITVDAALEKKLGKYLRSMNIDATAAVFRVRSGRLRAEIVGNVSALRSDDECLNKLSALLGVRLCSAPSGSSQRFVLLEAEPLMVTIGTSSARKAGNRVNGDNSFCFRTDDGKFYAILSDGMGSGEEADKISSTAISTLQKFLSAGISPELSLKLLSDSMFLKNETATESASVDLFELNMFTGETRIFKCGASPTYLKRGELIRRVSGGVLPAGLTRPSKEKPSCAKFRLQAESFAVLISDGVLSGTDDKWLRELISSFSDTDPKALARKILERSMELNGDMDDMTVLAIRIDDRD